MKSLITTKNKWKNFREEILKIDEYRCTKCGRGKEDNVVLQVHHKRYIHGRQLWEYSPNDCITLCKGCHAETHGLIMPKTNWVLAYYEDLGDLIGTCELCGTTLRHAFSLCHEQWPNITVGTYCCDNLTDTIIASNYMESQKSYERRLVTFINSPKWRTYNGKRISNAPAYRYAITRKHKGYTIALIATVKGFMLKINGIMGQQTYSSADSAKRTAFSTIESGKLQKYIEQHSC